LLSASAISAEQPVGALNMHGSMLVFDPAMLPAGGTPAQRAQYLRRSFSIIGLFSMPELASGNLFVVSTLDRLYNLRLTEGEAGISGGLYQVVNLAAHETLVGSLST
jgi:hypothetical protein